MSIDSNIDDLGAWLDEAIEEIGWDMPAPDGNGDLAGAVADVVTDGIMARALAKRGADANGSEEEWLDNEPQYRARKEKLYGEHNPNFRTNQMISRESIKPEGGIQSGRDEAVWTYGAGTPSPDGKTRRDRETLDTDKAWYAEQGQSEHQIRRPFFAVTEEDADDAMPVIEDAIFEHLQRKGTGT